MMDVQYRKASQEDIPEMVDVFNKALGDMWARHGVSLPIPPSESTESHIEHFVRTGVAYVAEKDGRIVSMSSAIVRDDLWYLSAFWTLPGHQRQGIGGSLLDLVWKAGEKAGARTFFTWSSIDYPAMVNYMRKGMLPGCQIISFRSKPRSVPPRPPGYEAVPLRRSVAMDIDRDVRGTAREEDHEYWVAKEDAVGRAVLRGGRVAGYYYVTKAGVGPMAWKVPRDAGPVLAISSRDAMDRNEGEVKLSIPGVNHDALRFALRCGLQVASTGHFLTTGQFGRLDRYIASGPALF